MADEFEKDRLEALAERRAAEFEGPDHRSHEARFGAGSFGCHEALHVTHLVVELIERELLSHGAVLLNPFWYGRIREAQALLHNAYSTVSQDHLAAPAPQDDAGQDDSRH